MQSDACSLPVHDANDPAFQSQIHVCQLLYCEPLLALSKQHESQGSRWWPESSMLSLFSPRQAHDADSSASPAAKSARDHEHGHGLDHTGAEAAARADAGEEEDHNDSGIMRFLVHQWGVRPSQMPADLEQQENMTVGDDWENFFRSKLPLSCLLPPAVSVDVKFTPCGVYSSDRKVSGSNFERTDWSDHQPLPSDMFPLSW